MICMYSSVQPAAHKPRGYHRHPDPCRGEPEGGGGREWCVTERGKHQQAVNQTPAKACQSWIELARARMGLPGTLKGGGGVCPSQRLEPDLIFDTERVAFECKSILIVPPSDRVKRNL